MWPDRVSNPGPLTYETGALPTALRGPADPYQMPHYVASDLGLQRLPMTLQRVSQREWVQHPL